LRHQQLADLGRAGEVRQRTSGFEVISPPISLADPVMTLRGMRPGREFANCQGESGVSLAGLHTKLQPAAGQAGAGDHGVGKFHGVMAATTPIGCLITTIREVTRVKGMSP
jgi:hypothetical protein